MAIFAAAYCVQDPFGKFVYHVGASVAPDRGTVISHYLEYVKQTYPTKEGYYNHSADVIEIPEQWLRDEVEKLDAGKIAS